MSLNDISIDDVFGNGSLRDVSSNPEVKTRFSDSEMIFATALTEELVNKTFHFLTDAPESLGRRFI